MKEKNYQMIPSAQKAGLVLIRPRLMFSQKAECFEDRALGCRAHLSPSSSNPGPDPPTEEVSQHLDSHFDSDK